MIFAWKKLITESFCHLQEARIMGGTLGHKVGPIWRAQKTTKEKYEGEILQLEYFN